ncbi:SufS family cysteine desulfurase [candidate division GN15 bacterium]|nr:SufS family cysteine desulfurase [candidate division GN15 bacterium]
MDVERIKADFPILSERINDKRLVYLDNAATSQKPREVINALLEYYRKMNANIHRGLHTLAERATSAYEHTRTHTADFIGGVKPEEIVFTRGTTESINLVAYTWGEQNIGEDDEILVSEMEHHANFVPWFQLAQRKGATIRKLPITVCGHLDLSDIDNLINEKTKLVAVSHMSNVFGTVNPVKDLAQRAHAAGALILTDGAQAAPHMPIDVTDLDVDFYAFSSHKMLGPTGVGVLYAREELYRDMPPFNYGGEMISQVGFDKVTFADLPYKFEGGTPNIADVIAFDAALSYLEKLGMENVHHHETEITRYALDRLSEVKGLEIQGPQDTSERGSAVSFTDKDIHPHDISTYLDYNGIAIRAGHHCAQPLMKFLGKVATARASFYIYNDRADVDALVEALIEMRRYFGV